MKIADFELGTSVMIIAELSANHGKNIDVAIKTIRAAKEAGADAIKLQTYTPDTITLDVDNDYFTIKEGLWKGRNLYELYAEAHTPWDWHEKLFEVAADEGLVCFSSPFDHTAVDLLERLGAPAYKIASFEIQDTGLIAYTAAKMKPIIISTGIASADDIQLAVDTCRSVGNEDIILLKCTSSYPAPIDLANLRTMTDMRKKFGVMTGLSDHTTSNVVATTATSLGAVLIEKHFILNRSLGGPDASFSLTPDEFKLLVESVRLTEASLGKVTYRLPKEVEANRRFGRSLFVVSDIQKGDAFSESNVRSIRPGDGLHPKHLNEIIGKIASQHVRRGTPLEWRMIES